MFLAKIGLALVLLFAIQPCALAQTTAQTTAPTETHHATQRLYLRDGSYQEVTEYHLAGDHVHYYSAERAAWEDVPMALVDMAKTQQWNANRDKEADQKRAARASERDAADAEVRKQLDAARPEVADGLRLPEKGNFWGLDTFQDKAELVPMAQPVAEAQARERARAEAAAQAKSESKKQRKDKSQIAQNEATAKTYEANAAMQPPLAPDAKNASNGASNGDEVRLGGTLSKREFHVPLPVFYLRADTLPNAKFVLIRMEQDLKHQQRFLAAPPAEALAGGSGKGFAAVQVEAMPGGKWLKVRMTADLPIGEYALARILSAQQWDAHVWDFGINPRAPEDGEALTVEIEKNK